MDGAGCLEASVSGICLHGSLQDASRSASSRLFVLGPTGSQRWNPLSPACSAGGEQGGCLHGGLGTLTVRTGGFHANPFQGGALSLTWAWTRSPKTPGSCCPRTQLQSCTQEPPSTLPP